MCSQLWIHDVEDLIHERNAFVYTFHTPTHVPGTFMRDEAIEGSERFYLTSCSIEKWRGHHIHSLHIPRTPRIRRNIASL
jgi:hypothetical protein